MRVRVTTEPSASSARPTRWSLARLAAWVVIVLGAVFFLTTGGTYATIASVQAHVVGQVIAVAILGGWLALALVRPAWRSSTPLLAPVALACLAYGASALVSQRPRLSFEPAIAGLGWAMAFLFLGRLFADDWFRSRAAVVMTAFVAVVSIGYLSQVVAEWIAWWGLVGRVAIPPLRPSFASIFFGSPNLIATALVLLAPLVVTIIWTRYQRHGVAVVLAVASALAIFVSGSRGAYLGVGFGVLLGFVLLATKRGTRASVRSVVARIRARPVFLLPIALVGALLVLAPSLLQRFAQGGATIRLDLWRSALTIFAEHPVLGAGPGTWVQLKVEANPAGVPNLILPHAHDLYIQAAAELGLVGLAAAAVLVSAAFHRLWSAWRSEDQRSSPGGDKASPRTLSVEAAAVLVSLTAFAVQSIVDNLVNLPFVCLLIVALVAWIDGRLAEIEGVGPIVRSRAFRWTRQLERGPWVPVAGLVVLALAIPTLVRIDRAASLAEAGNASALAGNWQAALDAYDAARHEDPGFTLYEIQTASALARVGRTVDARDMLAEAVESDPVAVNVIGLAALRAELGDQDGALRAVGEATERGVGEPMIALNAGLIAERLGARSLALDQFANAVAWNPPLASSGVWSASGRIVTKAEIVATARSRVDPLEAALILAYGGEPSSARAELEALPPSPGRDVYVAATEWLGGDSSAAIERLDAILAVNPHDWYAAAWAARILRLSGDALAADRYSKWAIAVQGDAAPGTIGETSVVPAPLDASTANLPGNYPWAVYLRPIAPFLPMPQVVLIGTQ